MPLPTPARRALALLATALLATGALAQGNGTGTGTGTVGATTGDDALVAQGQRIYEQGILAGGSPLSARAAGGVTLSGAGAACAVCHRPSGHGAREGESRVASITGPTLYAKPIFHQAERSGHPERPMVPPRRFARSAYDDALLVRAITQGIDPDSQPLEALMPRYELDRDSARALVAYLRQLGAATDPGVSAGSVRFATVVTDETDPRQRAIFLETLHAWSERGSVSGLETPLDVWELRGPPADWPAQLAAYQARQPAFALVSALGVSGWDGVQAFCESQRLPCLFPLLDVTPPPASRYAYYLTGGARLEARALAKWLDAGGSPQVVQLAEDDAGREAAAQLAASYGGVASTRKPGPDALPADATTVVAWVRTAGVGRLLATLPAGATLYLSDRLAPPRSVEVPQALRPRVRWISSRTDPQRLHAQALIETNPWLRSIGVAPGDEALQSELRVATWLVADALARMHGEWNREYLLETLESGMQPRPIVRIYQDFSLAVGQRLAVPGARVLGWPEPAAPAPVAISGLLIP